MAVTELDLNEDCDSCVAQAGERCLPSCEGNPNDMEVEVCDVCGHAPCDCDEQYDRWKERDW